MEFVTANGTGEGTSIKQISSLKDNMNSSDGRVIINDAEEKDIIEYVLQMTKISNQRTKKDLPRIVKYVLDKKRKKVLNDCSNLPSSNWVQLFLKRHTNLNSKIPLGRNPKSTTTYEAIKKFFSRLSIYLAEEHNIDAKTFLRRGNGHRIFTCDEGVFHLNSNEYSKKPGNLKKFSKFDVEGKSTRTVLMCMSASGNVLKPLIINSGTTTTQYEATSAHVDKYWSDCSDKGFVTAKIFYNWLVNCFEPYLNQTHIERPVLLFLDSHFCHLNIPALLFSKKTKIILYCLPVDASHLVQPIDSTCFKPMEENYRKCLKEQANTAGIIPPKMFASLLLTTMQKTKMLNKAVMGFENTGIVPMSTEAIDKSKLMTSNGNVESIVPDMSFSEDKEKHVPSYEDSIVVIQAELNALQDFLLRIETILPRPYVAHFEEKHDAGEDVLDHSFFIWRDLKEKIRDIKTWMLQVQEENPQLFQNSDPSIHLISQDNPSSFLQLQGNTALQNQIINFPVSSSHSNPMINFPEGTNNQNPMVGFHENATLQNVIESFPDNSLENFQENSEHQQNAIEEFSECSTPANPIVTFAESAQHHIECFTENTGNANSLGNEGFSYQNSVEIYTENNDSQNSEETDTESSKTSPTIGKRSSERGSPLKGKFSVGSLYRNPIVSLVRTPVANGKTSPEPKSKTTTTITITNAVPTSKKKSSPPIPTNKSKKKQEKITKRKSSEIVSSPKLKKSKKESNSDTDKEFNDEDNELSKDDVGAKRKTSGSGSCIVCKKKDGPNKGWIGCDCGNWCHKSCVNVSQKLTNVQIKKLEFKCSFCKKRKR